MIEIHEEVVRLLERGDGVAIATLVARRGSAPGALGSKMLVRSDGSTLGTIGGGCIEADVWQAGMSAQRSGELVLLPFRLNASDAAEGGLICGGAVDILVEPVSSQHLALYRRLSDVLKSRGHAVLGTVLPECASEAADLAQGGEPLVFAAGRKTLWIPGGETVGELPAPELVDEMRTMLDRYAYSHVRILCSAVSGHPVRVVLESFAPQSTVYVFGAGHLSKEIVPLAKRVGFHVVVVDDRAFFANREGFPEADELMVADFGSVFDDLQIDADSYLVIVTRGHQHDEVVLRQALRVRPAYIGMIGSRTKIASIYGQLRAEGFSQEELDAVHAPIGVPIQAKSPEEIAISILAELISVRGQGGR